MISLQNVFAAEPVVRAHLAPTPLIHYPGLSELVEAEVYVKHENHLPGGSFKIRGGINTLHHLKREGVGGVITFSTGNHGISIARSAQLYGVEAVVVVPKGSNPSKIDMIRHAGARVFEEGETFEEAAAFGLEYRERHGLRFIHAVDEPHIINGVGTEFLEILRDLPDVDAVVLPIGGGSELAAAVTVLKAVNPGVEIYAVQAAASRAAYLSWKSGKIVTSENRTFADGFATGQGFETTFGIYRDRLSGFVLLEENEIYSGMRLALEHTHNLAEGAGGSTIMAAVKLRDSLRGKKVVLQMSGGNETLDNVRKALA